MSWNINAARQEGYSDQEIAEYLAGEQGVDLKPALDEGYSYSEIISHLGAPPPEPLLEAAVRGGKESFQQLPQLGYGLLGMAGAAGEKVFGAGGVATSMKEKGVEGYREWSGKIESDSRPEDSWSYAWDRAKNEGDIDALMSWASHGLGNVLGQASQTMATAGVGKLAAQATLTPVAERVVGGMVAKEAAKLAAGKAGQDLVAEMGEEGAKAFIQKQAVKNVTGNIGIKAATAASAFGLEGGEIGGDIATQAVEEGREVKGSEIAKFLGGTAAAGSLEYLGDMISLDVFLGKAKLGKLAGVEGVGGRLARGAAMGAEISAGEGATEFGQTYAEEWAKGKDITTRGTFGQAVDAAAQGALTGVLGGARGVATKAKPQLSDITNAGTIEEAGKAALDFAEDESAENADLLRQMGIEPDEEGRMADLLGAGAGQMLDDAGAELFGARALLGLQARNARPDPLAGTGEMPQAGPTIDDLVYEGMGIDAAAAETETRAAKAQIDARTATLQRLEQIRRNRRHQELDEAFTVGQATADLERQGGVLSGEADGEARFNREWAQAEAAMRETNRTARPAIEAPSASRAVSDIGSARLDIEAARGPEQVPTIFEQADIEEHEKRSEMYRKAKALNLPSQTYPRRGPPVTPESVRLQRAATAIRNAPEYTPEVPESRTTLPEKLAAAVGKPEEIDTIKKMGVVEPEAQVERVVSDALQPANVAVAAAKKGKSEMAKKALAIAEERGAKLKAADGELVDALVDEELRPAEEAVAAIEQKVEQPRSPASGPAAPGEAASGAGGDLRGRLVLARTAAQVNDVLAEIFDTHAALDKMDDEQGDVHSGLLAVADDYMADLEHAIRTRNEDDIDTILGQIAEDKELPHDKRELLRRAGYPARNRDVHPPAPVQAIAVANAAPQSDRPSAETVAESAPGKADSAAPSTPGADYSAIPGNLDVDVPVKTPDGETVPSPRNARQTIEEYDTIIGSLDALLNCVKGGR